jgi:hypothetical protein
MHKPSILPHVQSLFEFFLSVVIEAQYNTSHASFDWVEDRHENSFKIKENDEHCLIFGFGILVVFGFEIELFSIALTTVLFLGRTETDAFRHR